MYHELTVWSRGIIMDKEARDVSSCIAAAARALGYYADNVSDYVDDPDRTNCLVRRYARFGDSPIVDRFVYENPAPGLGGAGRGDDHQGGQLPARHPRTRRRGGRQLGPRPRVPAEVPARRDEGQDGQVRRGGRGRPGRAAGQQPVDVRPQPVRAGLRPDVHRGRGGAARDRDGHRRPADRRAGRRYRRTARWTAVAEQVADRDAMFRGAAHHRGHGLRRTAGEPRPAGPATPAAHATTAD